MKKTKSSKKIVLKITMSMTRSLWGTIRSQALIFSPDSCMLTCSGCDGNTTGGGVHIVTWDLQTGGVVSAIKQHFPTSFISITPCITYSKDGEMVGLLRTGPAPPTISLLNVVSGVYMYDIDHSIYTDVRLPNHLEPNSTWTHGKTLQFATIHLAPITIWEVGFTPSAMPTQVEMLSVPDNTHDRSRSHVVIAQISPASYQLALFYPCPINRVYVWDTRDSKHLLCHQDVNSRFRATFSSDGQFFVCSSPGSEVYLWKEYSAGYKLHRKLAPGIPEPIPLLSPDGELIIAFGHAAVWLWHTKLLPPTPSSAAPQHTEDFVLDFLPNRPSVVVA